MRKTVALMRAEDDAARSAARLAARGYEAALAPALEFAARAAPSPLGRFDGAIVTSARAFAFAGAERARLDDLPLYVVGPQAAAGARKIAAVAKNAAALAQAIVTRLPRGSRLLYLAGVDRKPDLERALGAAGFEVVILEVYEARARKMWSEAEAARIARSDAALHYSRRSAGLACRLADQAGLVQRWRALVHVAISDDAAAPLRAFDATIVVVAKRPDEAAMLDALDGKLSP